MRRLPRPIRRRALECANELAAEGLKPQRAVDRAIEKAWATEAVDGRRHYNPNVPPGPARFLYPVDDDWMVITLGPAKDRRCANFAWALHRAEAACGRDNGVIYVRLARDSTDLVTFSGPAALEASDIYVSPLRKGRWAVSRVDFGDSVYERHETLEPAIARACELGETLETPVHIFDEDGEFQEKRTFGES